MIRNSIIKPLVVAIPLCCTSFPALSAPLGMADAFNAYAISSFSYSETDIQGIIGSGGDVTFIGGTEGVIVKPGNQYSIYSGGNVHLESHHVGGGGIQANGTVRTEHVSISGDVNAGSDVEIRHGSIAGDVDAGGSFKANNNAINAVNAQGTVQQSSGAIGPVNATGDVTIQSASMRGNVNSDGSIDITGSSSGSRINLTAEQDIAMRNLNLNANATAGGSFTGTSGYIQGDVAGNEGITKSGFGIGGTQSTSGGIPDVQVAAHQSDAIDHEAIAQGLRETSTGFATMAATGSVVDNDGNPSVDNYTISGNSGLNIFDLTGDMLTDFASMTFNGYADSSFVFNVSGFDIDIVSPGGFHFNGLDESQILFNFSDALTIDMTGSFWGTILAPKAAVNYIGHGTLFGSLYADTITGNRQINAISYTGVGPIAEVPEPSVLLLFGVGLIGLLGFRRKQLS